MAIVVIWLFDSTAEERTISMSLDPQVDREIGVEDKTAQLKMVIDSGEPETTVESWVWIGAFTLFGVAALCGDFPDVLVVKLVLEDVVLVTSFIVPDTITVDQFLDKVELSYWTVPSNADIIAVEADEPGRAVVVTPAIATGMLEEPKGAYLALLATANEAVSRTRGTVASFPVVPW